VAAFEHVARPDLDHRKPPRVAPRRDPVERPADDLQLEAVRPVLASSKSFSVMPLAAWLTSFTVTKA
jgi:hypothetical protein